MTASPTLEETMGWAADLHAGQIDRLGSPYVGHVARVAGHLLRLWPDIADDILHAAWLHDAVEDTGIGPDDIRRRGYSEATVGVVLALSRTEGEIYERYIDRLIATGDAAALKLKIADLTDHLDPVRLARLEPEQAARLAGRYRGALVRVREALARLEPG